MGILETAGKTIRQSAIKVTTTGVNMVGKGLSDFIKGLNTDSFNVLMLGGRRCGKTSVLATILHDFNNNIQGDLALTIRDVANSTTFAEKYDEMERYASSKDSFDITPDTNPSFDVEEYNICLKLKSHPTGTIDVKFTDVPGEFMRSGGLTDGELDELIEKTNMFIIAVDTPYLMEADGSYAEKRNFCEVVCNWIHKIDVSDEAAKKSYKKMVLFVPLKCEKYMNDGKMEEVNNKIHARYKSAFNYLGGSTAHNCVVAITPIVTMGIIEFAMFDRNKEDGSYIEIDGLPMAKYYKRDSSKTELAPRFCEQPIYYLLAYILKSAADKHPEKGGILGVFQWVSHTFMKLPNRKDWLAQTDWVLNRIKTSGDGYELISDPLHFKRS